MTTGPVPSAWTTVASPVGDLLLVATAEGLLRVAFAGEDHGAVRARLAERLGRPPARHGGAAAVHLDVAAAELAAFFTGIPTRFGVPLDLRLVTPFRREVLAVAAARLGHGATATYAELAAAAGRPRAVRAVASALATNPVPLVVPCHRVLRAGGALGGYLGGLPAKRFLLELEQRAVPTGHHPGAPRSLAPC